MRHYWLMLATTSRPTMQWPLCNCEGTLCTTGMAQGRWLTTQLLTRACNRLCECLVKVNTKTEVCSYRIMLSPKDCGLYHWLQHNVFALRLQQHTVTTLNLAHTSRWTLDWVNTGSKLLRTCFLGRRSWRYRPWSKNPTLKTECPMSSAVNLGFKADPNSDNCMLRSKPEHVASVKRFWLTSNWLMVSMCRDTLASIIMVGGNR